MTPHRIAAYAAVAAVAAAIAAGLYLSGSPTEQRLLRLDERRVSDLRTLANALSRHVTETGRLPDTLDALVDGRRLTRLPSDPASEEPYAYVVTGSHAFELCADFDRESAPRMQGDFWSHSAGRACFSFDYSGLRRPNPTAR